MIINRFDAITCCGLWVFFLILGAPSTSIYARLYVKPLVGTGIAGILDNNGPAAPATLAQIYSWVCGIWADSIGNVFIAENDGDDRIRVINASGIIMDFGGNGSSGHSGVSGPPTSVSFYYPISLVGDASGRYMYMSDSWYIWRHDFTTGIMSVIAGTATPGFSGDGGPASLAQFYFPGRIWMTTSGILYIADIGNYRIRKISITGIITTFAGNGMSVSTGDGGPALSAGLIPFAVYADSFGNVYSTDTGSMVIRRVDSNNIITTFAGVSTSYNDFSTYNGDNIPATLAFLTNPLDVKGDKFGNIYIADSVQCRIRKVDSFGIITTFLGNQQCGTSLTVTSTPASIYSPTSLWVDSQANLYFNEGGVIIRQTVTSETLLAPTLEPTSTASSRMFLQSLAGVGYRGDHTETGVASFTPIDAIMLWVDSIGNIYFCDGWNRILKIDSVHGILTVFGGTASTTGISGPIASVSFQQPYSIVGDTANRFLYISDQFYIWKYSFSSDIATVVAGSASFGFSGDNGPATSAQLQYPLGIWVSTNGELFIADTGNHRIRKISTGGIITTVAGATAGIGFSGDNGLATSAKLNYPTAVCVDVSGGKMYVADSNNYRIRVIDAGIITTFAGNGMAGIFTGDYVLATLSTIGEPRDIKMDSLGNVFIASNSNRIFKVNTAGILSNFIGTGSIGFTFGVTSLDSGIDIPTGIWIDSQDMLYFTDGSSIRKTVLLASTFTLPPRFSDLTAHLYQEKLAGGYQFNYTADSVTATSARIYSTGFWVSQTGTIYYADPSNFIIRKVNVSGIINTVGGTAGVGGSVVGTSGPVTSTVFYSPYWVVGDNAGTYLYICDRKFIWKYTFSTDIIEAIAGSSLDGFSGDGGPAWLGQFHNPSGMWLTTAGDLYIVDSENSCLRMISVIFDITTVVGTADPNGGFSGDHGPAVVAFLYMPVGVYVDSTGCIYIADTGNSRIRFVDELGIITTFAGNVNQMYNGDNIPATRAFLNEPNDVKGDRFGNIYIADTKNCRIRIVDTSGIISTLIGDGFTHNLFAPSFSSVTSTSIGQPQALWIDTQSNLYFSNFNSIHKTILMTPTSQPSSQPISQPSRVPSSQPTSSPSAKAVTFPNLYMQLLAGQSITGYAGDGGSATLAKVNTHYPWVDSIGNIYLADYTNYRIRKIDLVGIITTIGGTGTTSTAGVGGPIASVAFNTPYSIVGSNTNLFISDMWYIWKYSFDTGIVSVIAGTGTPGFSGDGGPASLAKLSSPRSIWLTSDGELFIVDSHRIRKISSSGIITTVAGSAVGAVFAGDNGPATSASLYSPRSVYVSTTSDKMFIADSYNHRIRLVNQNNIITTFAGTGLVDFNGDSIKARNVNLNFPNDVKGDSIGNIYISDGMNYRIRMVNTKGIITTLFGSGVPGYIAGITPATAAIFEQLFGIWIDSNSVLYFSDKQTIHRSIVIMPPTSQPSAQPGSKPSSQPSCYPTTQPSGQPRSRPSSQPSCQPTFHPSEQPASRPTTQPSSQPSSQPTSLLRNQPSSRPTCQPSSQPSSLPSGQPWSRPTSQPSLQPTSSPSGDPMTFPNLFMESIAGKDLSGFSGDNGPATAALINGMIPWVDSSGDVYIPDYTNHRIRKVDSDGIITTFGGTGVQSTIETPGLIRDVSFYSPFSIVGNNGSLYISDQWYVWKCDLSSGYANVIAGTAIEGSSGDNGPSSLAKLKSPKGLWLTTAGVLYIADSLSQRIKMISTSGILTTVAGYNVANLIATGFGGDHGLATSAFLNSPSGVYMNTVGKLFIADANNHRIRVVDTNNIITTFAGTGATGYNGDNMNARNTNLYYPMDVKGDVSGNIYIADSGNFRIRVVGKSGMVATFFGTGVSGFSYGISPAISNINGPYGIWVDSSSTVYFSDMKSIHKSLVMALPTSQPSQAPSNHPTVLPTAQPVLFPTTIPTSQPTNLPSSSPSRWSSSYPSTRPSVLPSIPPTVQPSSYPTSRPTVQPSCWPTGQPTKVPSGLPISRPTLIPSVSPSIIPTLQPSSFPSCTPTAQPATVPSTLPTSTPSSVPTTSGVPTLVSSNPPTALPTSAFPSVQPSLQLEVPSAAPSIQPSGIPSVLSSRPSLLSSEKSTCFPSVVSSSPTVVPSVAASASSAPTLVPSCVPLSQSTVQSTNSPTICPSLAPSYIPTCSPGHPTSQPSRQPSAQPSKQPVSRPSSQPSRQPSSQPSLQPSSSPSSSRPTSSPTLASSAPTPVTVPSISSSPSTTRKPTRIPSVKPTRQPTAVPTQTLSVFPVGSKNFRGSLFLLGTGSGSSETDSNNVNLNDKLANQRSYIVFGEDHKKKKLMNIEVGSGRDSVSLSSVEKLMSRETFSRSVTIVGDINNDGNHDLIVGFPVASTCLVYLGSNNGFTNLIVSFSIYGTTEGDDFGWSVSKAGNINHDEYGDFVICAKTAGICYVLYGKAYFKDIYVQDMTSEDGFRIFGSVSTTISFGVVVDYAGDFNKDGYDDIVISAMSFTSQGIIYVVFGRPVDALNHDIVVDESSSLVYSIFTPPFSFAGLSLAGVGDMNKDGFDDIAIGSVPYRGGYQTQRSYVIFGRTVEGGSHSLDVNEMIVGKDGFTITGGGFLVSGVGDLNADGIADLMITSYYDWRGKSNGYLINYPTNMTSSPTYFPSSSPSLPPSVSPSVFPTQAPSTSTPSNLPSVITSPPVLGINESASPTVIQSSKPSKKTSQPTVKATVVPSYTPSTKTPSCEPSFVPSLMPSRAPFSNRTRRPQSAIRYRPTGKPIIPPTPIPTSGSIVSSMNTLSFSVVELIEPGEYTGSTDVNQNFVFSLTGSGRYHVVAHPPHINDSSVKVFSLKPMNDQVVIIDEFRTSSDIIDLHQFPLIQTLDDISFSTNPLTILLPKWVTDADQTTQSRQRLTIATFQTFESFSEQNFIFRKAKGFHSGVKTSNYSFQLLLGFGVIIGVLSVIGFLKCLTEDLNEEQKEAEKKKRESMLSKEMENDNRENVEINDDEEAQRKQIMDEMDKETETRALIAARDETVLQESRGGSVSSDENSSSSSSSNNKQVEGDNSNTQTEIGDLAAENEELPIDKRVKDIPAASPPKEQHSTNAESDLIDDFSISSLSSEDKEAKPVAVSVPNPVENAIQTNINNIEDDIDKIMTEDVDRDSGDVDDPFSSDDDDDDEDSLDGWFPG
jgi:sugar lactone lactonase YvrE